MSPTRHRFAAGLAVTLLAAWPALAPAHTLGATSNFERPLSYTAAVRLIHIEMGEIDKAREGGYFLVLAEHAEWLAMLAETVPSLAESLSDSSSVNAEFVRVADSLTVTARELRNAAARRQIARIEPALTRIGTLFTALDAHVPKQYVCPMHCEPGRIYHEPGTCPVCKMDLQLVTNDRYTVEVVPETVPLRAGQTATLSFQIRDPAGFPPDSLQIVHEKPMHLMIVSQDLSQFAHVHPVFQGNGHFELRYKFPTGGTYTLFNDFTPWKVGMQVVPVDLDVKGNRPPLVALAIDDTLRKRVDGIDVTMTHTWFAVGAEGAMTFTLMHHGKPVTDLEPYLGAMGHLVVIHEDRSTYVHSHPLATTPGPDIQFNMVFAKTGLYRAWGQFQRKGKVITVPFVVEVTLDGHPRHGGSVTGSR